jgi:site-specific recombinase XerD
MRHKQVVDHCLSFREAVLNFLLDQEISNRSRGTIEAQRIVLGFLTEFAEEEGWPSVGGVEKSHLRQYLAALKGRPKRSGGGGPISDSYYETQYRRIKRFFNWCVAEGYVNVNPVSDIPHPKVGRRVIQTVSDDDFRKLLRLTDPALYRSPARNFPAVRDQALLWLMADTPGRRHELARLTLESVDLKGRRVLVEGKGRRERYMYFGAVTTKALTRYKARRDALESRTGDWWVDCHGSPMNQDWLYRMLKRLGKRAGIPGLHPHMFRHTFSVNMIEADVPLPTLEVMGGWERIPKTYLATLGDRAARAAHRRVSPADRLANRG